MAEADYTPFWGRIEFFCTLDAPKNYPIMQKLLVITLLLAANLCLGQATPKKITGKWVTCTKIETLVKLDTVSFTKEDAGLLSTCIEKNCGYSRWTFDKADGESKVEFFRQAGCKDAASTSDKSFTGSWNLEKDKKTLTVFDDHFTKHTFEIVAITDKEFKIKRKS